MEDILLSSPLFDLTKSNQYDISIQLGLNGFSFCIIDPISNKLIYLSHTPAFHHGDLDNIIKSSDILSSQYHHVNVLMCYPKITSAPASLCQQEEIQDILKLTHTLEETESVYHDIQSFVGIGHIYALPTKLVDTIKIHFPDATIKHHQALITWIGMQHEPKLKEQRVFLSIWDKSFHMAVIKGESVEFMNHFNYDVIDDFLYFFLFAFKQLNLDPSETRVIVHEKIFKQSILCAKLKKFVAKIEFSQWPKNLNYSNSFMELPGHYFSNLCLLHLCE